MRFRRLKGKHYLMEAGELKCYGPGTIFEGDKAELGQSLDQWEQIDPDPEPDPPPEPIRRLFPRPRGFRGKGEWDVINPETGQPINDKPLTKAEAMAMSEGAGERQALEAEGHED